MTHRVALCYTDPSVNSNCNYDAAPDPLKLFQHVAHVRLLIRPGDSWFADGVAATPKWNGFILYNFWASGTLTQEEADA